MARCSRSSALSALCFGLATISVHGEVLKNHYNDRFIYVTQHLSACPQPRGPFMTEREAQMEAHPRIERGTSCFMAGKCSEANAYRYDARIAKAAQEAVANAARHDPGLARSSVWLTVQRRFVFVQGCVADRAQVARWQALIKAVPDVEYVGVDLAVVARAAGGLSVGRVPYPVMP